MKIVIAVVILAGIGLAQEKKEKPAPSVPDLLKAEYWQSQSKVNEAVANLMQARVSAEAVIAKLKTACGEAPVVLDEKGHPSCGRVPEKK